MDLRFHTGIPKFFCPTTGLREILCAQRNDLLLPIDEGAALPTKVDFKKSLDSYQARKDQFRLVKVPDLLYLMIDGQGDPNTSSDYISALETIYPLAYKLKFASKREFERDYVMPPLEGLWWAEDMTAFSENRDKSQWNWTMMLMVPEWVGADLVAATAASMRAIGGAGRLDEVRFETLTEGLCVQTLHVGSFDAEGPVLEAMHHSFMPEHGLAFNGKHHEIYLNDARKTAPERLRTILRQPVVKLGSETAA